MPVRNLNTRRPVGPILSSMQPMNTMKPHRRLAALLTAAILTIAVAALPGAAAPGDPAEPPPRHAPGELLAHRLHQMATLVLTPPARPDQAQADKVADQRLSIARILLGRATQLDPTNAELWRLKLEAGEADREASLADLRRYVQAAPQDDLAQLRLIDAMAQQAQTADARRETYERFLSPEAARQFSASLRSRIAWRVASLYQEQADNAKFVAYLKQAITLDETNKPACAAALDFLRDQKAGRPEITQALLNLLAAAPSDGSVHAQLGSMLLSCGQYTPAATWFESASRIWSVDGYPQGEDPMQLVSDQALALWGSSRSTDALRLLESYGAPSPAPAAPNPADKKSDAATLPAPGAPTAPQPGPTPATPAAGAAPAPVATPAPPAAVKLPSRLQGLVVAMHYAENRPKLAADAFANLDADLQQNLKAHPDDVEALSVCIWARLLLNQDIASVEPLMTRYRAAKPPADTLRRLEGWLLLRQGKSEDARKLLAADTTDAGALLGLAFIEESTHDKAKTLDAFNRAFAQSPGSITGLIAASRITAMGGRPTPSADAAAVGRLVQQVPRDFQVIVTEPRRFVMLRLKPVRLRYTYGEPIEIELELTNVWDAPLSLGSGGTINSTVVLSPFITDDAGQMQAMAPQVVDLGRRIRLDARQSLSVVARIDTGALAEALVAAPLKSLRLSVTGVLNPRVAANGTIVPGLLGGVSSVRLIERSGWSPVDALVAERTAALTGADPGAAMLSAALLSRVAIGLPADKKELAEKISESVNTAFAHFTPAQQAWAISYLTAAENSQQFNRKSIDEAINSTDLLVQQMAVLSVTAAVDSPILTTALRSEKPELKKFAEDYRKVLADRAEAEKAAKAAAQAQPKPDTAPVPAPPRPAPPPATGTPTPTKPQSP